MQLVFHTGAHFTEEDRLMKCLLRNKEMFRSHGVAVPGPGSYRKLMRQTLEAMSQHDAAPNARAVLLDAILDDENADRMLLSNAHFFGTAQIAVRNGRLYPKAAERMNHLASIFHGDEIELFMAVRNPATFLPACFKRSQHETFATFMGGADPRSVQWSDTFLRLRSAVPEVPLTVWCNEDLPLLWGQIVREIGGLQHGDPITGAFDLLRNIMSRQGMARFAAYIERRPNLSEGQTRRIVGAFLNKYALDEKIDEEIDLPGWTTNLVNEMTELYDDDVAAIGRIPGVRLIMPD